MRQLISITECLLYTRDKDVGGSEAGFMKDSMSTSPWFKDTLPEVSSA